MPTMHNALTRATPNATPAPGSKRRAGTASTSKYSGPGWLTSVFTLSETDDHDPISGRCVREKRSRDRMAHSALSSVGIQPWRIARVVATATGTSATTTDAKNKRVVRRVAGDGDGPRPVAPAASPAFASVLSATSSTLAPGVGPGFTSAHGLTWADEHGRREPQVRHAHDLLARRVGYAGGQAETGQAVVDGGHEGGSTCRSQLVDDLRAESLVLGPFLRGAGVGVSDLARAALRPPDVDVVGADREVDDTRCLGGVDHAVARRTGAIDVEHADVEPAPVELVHEAVAHRADIDRVAQGDEVQTVAPATRRRAAVQGGGRRADEETERPRESWGGHVCRRRVVREERAEDHRHADQDGRSDGGRAGGRRTGQPPPDEHNRRPHDGEHHQRTDPPRPEPEVVPDEAEDASQRHERKPQRDA